MKSCSAVLSWLLLVAAATLGGPAAPARAQVGGLLWPAAPTASAEARQAPCGDVLFVGVRGSGETPPYGTTIQTVRDRLALATRAVPDRAGVRVREVWLDYPAVAPQTLGEVGVDALLFSRVLPSTPFFDSVDTGRDELAALLDDARARCPQEQWLLVGFSQGAEVIQRTLAQRHRDAPLLAALLMGNPARTPAVVAGHRVSDGEPVGSALGLSASFHYLRQAVADSRSAQDTLGASGAVRGLVELGTGQADPAAVRRVVADQRLAIPAELAARVTEACRTDDLVCDSGPALARIVLDGTALTDELARARPVHNGYPDLGDPLIQPSVDAVLAWLPPPEPVVVPGVPWWRQPVVVGAGAAVLLVGGTVLSVLVSRARRRPDANDAGRRPDANEAAQPVSRARP